MQGVLLPELRVSNSCNGSIRQVLDGKAEMGAWRCECEKHAEGEFWKNLPQAGHRIQRSERSMCPILCPLSIEYCVKGATSQLRWTVAVEERDGA